MAEGSINPEFLLENTGWLKALALSLVGDAALAEDVVQETWVAALRRPPLHARTARGWLARVVRNLASRTYRDRTRRIRRENVAARNEDVSCTPEQLLQRAELQRDIAQAIIGLKEPYRSTILMRFFEGLSIKAISFREETPITTVRSRLARGLEQLRVRLDRRYGGDRQAWCAILIPLAGLSAAPVATVASTSLALGGALMTQKALLMIGVTALSAIALTVAIVQTRAPRGPEDHLGEGQHVSVGDHESLQKRYDDAIERLRGAEARLAEYGGARQKQESGDEVASADQNVKKPGDPAKASIDWSAMASFIGENVGMVVEALKLAEEGKPYPDELKRKLGGFGSRLVLYGFQIRGISKFPILDRTLFSDMIAASSEKTLNLTERQLQLLSASNQALFDEMLGDADPAELLPLERHQVRSELLARSRETVEGLLEKHQLENEKVMDNLETMKRLTDMGQSVVVGVSPIKEYGLGAPDVAQDVLNDWQNDYALTSDQVTALDESAADYVKRARGVVERYGETEEEIAALSTDLRDALQRELLEMQVQEELRIVSHLNDSQREAIEKKRPTIRRFDLGLEAEMTTPTLLQDLDTLLGI